MTYNLQEIIDERKGAGFPLGDTKDIISISDPEHYTAYPNPFFKEFIERMGKRYNPQSDTYQKTPYSRDIIEGKNDPFYMAHSYPTKVPPLAIQKYIEHYTEPEDIILDCFCGSGMTGVAASRTNRFAILNDLSPLASFISYNYNTKITKSEFNVAAKKIIQEIENECKWMLETNHTTEAIDRKTRNKVSTLDATSKGQIIYTVWSDVLKCTFCEEEFVQWDVAVDMNKHTESKQFHCPKCDAELTINSCSRVFVKKFDSGINKEISIAKQVPVLINYKVGKKRYEKKPDEHDIIILKRIAESEIPYWYPTNELPPGFNTQQPKTSHGFTHIHHFYSKRNLWILAAIYQKIFKIDNKRLRNYLLSWFTSGQSRLFKMNRFMASHNRHVGPLSGTLYISSYQAEISPFYFIFEDKYKRHQKIDISTSNCYVSCGSSTDLGYIPSDSIDYIFIDPPFGDNLMYSELNFLIEGWLKVFENNQNEVIINDVQNKGLDEYTSLMTDCFIELFRVLKPNRWITVEFHNSQASVWNAIQESMTRAGFIISQVAILDKVKGTTKQLSYGGTVKNDLIINAYKPKKEFTERFLRNAGEGMEIDFVSQQLEHIPVHPNIERMEKMLYSKILAHYVENGFKIMYDSTNFYKLLSDNFVELDGYWFLDSQVKEYNEWKSGLSLDQMKEVLDGQQVLFVSDEKSALTWSYNFLHQPSTYSEIYTAYQQVATITDDKIPELKELLDNNFILENGKYRRPINREEREEINKNRERELERAFQKLLKQAREQKGKIRNVRREALVYGFTKCYQEGRYQDILTVANKLYGSTLEASGDIMDFVNIARIKTSGEEKRIKEYQ